MTTPSSVVTSKSVDGDAGLSAEVGPLLPPELEPYVQLLRGSCQPMALTWGATFHHNVAFAELVGRGADNPLHALADVVQGVDELSAWGKVDAALDGRSQWLRDCCLRAERDGAPVEVWFDLSLTPVSCGNAARPGLLLIASDSSKEHRATAERERTWRALVESERRAALLQAISDASSDVIYVKDQQGRLLFANPATLALIGRPEHEVIGCTDQELLHDAAAAEAVMSNDRRVMASGVAEDLEEMVPGADGTLKVWHSRKMPWRSGDSTLGLLGISRDITARKRLEAEAAASAAQVQRVLNSISDGVAFLDRDWRYTYFNEQGARLLGVRREDILGGCVWELFPHAQSTAFGEAYRRAVATGNPEQFEAYYPEPLNAWVECRCYPSDDGLAVFFNNVTERHQTQTALRESENRLRRVFDANPIGMAVGDVFGRITQANPAFLRLVERSAEDLASGALRWDEITPVEHSPVDREAVAAVVRDGVSSVYEKEYFVPSGRRVPVLVACARLSEDGEELVAFVIDISDRKRAERQLREADENKSRFIAMLAHELRNPLAPIRSGVALLQREPPADIAKRTLQIMERQIKHIVRLTDDLLDIGRISTGKIQMRFEPGDLRGVVQVAVDAMRPMIEDSGHVLVVDLPERPCIAEIDHARLVQAVSNLLSNACRYTPRGGHIDVSLRSGELHANLTVADDGIGIASENLNRVFDLFFQEPDRAENRQAGLGIGLALARQLVTAHGGEIRAYSDGPARGSRFAITMALLRDGAQHQQEPAVPVEATASPGRRVLIVDDNVDAIQALAYLLSDMGHEVRCLPDGSDLLEEARRFCPQVVLLDIGLPGRSGYELATELASSWEGRPGAVVAALTGWSAPVDQEAARRAGFDHHLAKPVELDAIKQLLSDRRRAD